MYEEKIRRDKRQREQEMKARLDDLTIEQIYNNRNMLIQTFLEEYQYSESVEVHKDEMYFVRVGETYVEARIPFDGSEEELRLKPRKMETMEDENVPSEIVDDYIAYRYNILERPPADIREDVEERLDPIITNTDRLSKQLHRTNDYFERKINQIVQDEYEVAKRVVERLEELDADESEYTARDREVVALPASEEERSDTDGEDDDEPAELFN